MTNMNKSCQIDPRAIARGLLSLRDDPSRFNEIALGRAPYWSRQVEIAQAVAAHKNVIVATGNAVGKSYLAAGLVLWWLFTRPNSLVVATAPSQTLLGTVLFREIRKALASSQAHGLGLTAKVTESSRASPQTIEITPSWSGLGISTRGVERLSGQHNSHLLVMIDEASGVLPEIWEALTSLNPSKLIAFGNPLESGSPFHKFYLRGLEEGVSAVSDLSDDQRTVAIRVSSQESPDIALGRSPRGLADISFIHEAERQWGRNTPLWQSHIEGLFPDSATHGLLEPFWIDRAFEIGVRRREFPIVRDRCIMAIDLSAGVGADRTAIVVRDYHGIIDLIASPRLKIAETAFRIDELARRYCIPQHHIVYDASGLGRDLPRELEVHQLHCVPYFGAGSGGSLYLNQRAAVAWKLRNRLDPERHVIIREPDADYVDSQQQIINYEYERCKVPWINRMAPPRSLPSQLQDPFHIPPLPHGPSLRQELLELRYQNKGLKIALEPKDQLAKRLGRSPDLADALLMSFAIDDSV